MKRKKLKCKCGAEFENDGVFITCERCRHAYTEQELKEQSGCQHWSGVSELTDKRVIRVERDSQTF